jgi:hypothetical protein
MSYDRPENVTYEPQGGQQIDRYVIFMFNKLGLLLMYIVRL